MIYSNIYRPSRKYPPVGVAMSHDGPFFCTVNVDVVPAVDVHADNTILEKYPVCHVTAFSLGIV